MARRRLTLAIAAGVLFVVAAAAVAWRLKPASAVPVRVLEISSEMPGSFALSPDGSAVAYVEGGHLYVRTFNSLEPQELGDVAPGPNQQVFLSPDGKWIAYASEGMLRRVPASGGSPFVLCAIPATGHRAAFIVNARNALNLVVRDLETGADTPFSFNRPTDVKGTWNMTHPAWFPAGDRLVYAAGGVETASRIFEQRLDRVAPPRELIQGIWAAVFPDGRSFFTIEDVRARGKLSRVSIRGDGSVGPAEVLTPDLDVHDADASPDGTLGAVGSHDESGHLDIVLVRLDGSARRRITTGGATRPRFSPDGRWLYYVEGAAENGRTGGRLVRVPVTSPVALQVGKVEVVLGDSSASDRLDVAQYDVGPGDRRFLVPVEEPGRRSRAVLVQNWPGLVASR